jgi:hypothetical protein
MGGLGVVGTLTKRLKEHDETGLSFPNGRDCDRCGSNPLNQEQHAAENERSTQDRQASQYCLSKRA